MRRRVPDLVPINSADLPVPPIGGQRVALMNSLQVAALLVSIVVAGLTGPITALVGRTNPEPVSCVTVVEELRNEISGHPERLDDYLDPGTDGLSVLSQDERAKQCGIDEADLKRWASTVLLSDQSSGSSKTKEKNGR